MNKSRFKLRAGWRATAAAGAFCAATLAIGPAMSTEGIDPQADTILKSMSAYLGGTKAFSVKADIENEIMTHAGQKLQLSSFSTVVMERPGKFNIQRRGMIADIELIFDGKTLTLYGRNLNAYTQIDVSGTIDDAIRAYESETGIPAPGADLFFSDPYEILSSGVKSSAYFGTAYVNGVESHHLAFREDNVDWQLWVQAGDEPLPMKYVITSKWQTGAPQYEIRFRDWSTKPRVDGDQFTFSAPQGAGKLDINPVSELGEFVVKENK